MDRAAAKELVHVQVWLGRIVDIVERGETAYLGDTILQEAGDSLMMKIGEAANRLSRIGLQGPGDVDWAVAIANRNFLIHRYDSVNRHLTWLTLSRDLINWQRALEPYFERARTALGAG